MGMHYPALKLPDIDPAIISLETGKSGLVDTVRRFLEGYYDPTADQFRNYVNVIRRGSEAATTGLRKNILAAQGAQRIYGGAAGKQLNTALINKIRNDLDLEQKFLWDALKQTIDNRKYGLNSGKNIVDSNRQYALGIASMENDYNAKKWQAQLENRTYRRSTARNFRNLIPPSYITSGINLLTKSIFRGNSNS